MLCAPNILQRTNRVRATSTAFSLAHVNLQCFTTRNNSLKRNITYGSMIGVNATKKKGKTNFVMSDFMTADSHPFLTAYNFVLDSPWCELLTQMHVSNTISNNVTACFRFLLFTNKAMDFTEQLFCESTLIRIFRRREFFMFGFFMEM